MPGGSCAIRRGHLTWIGDITPSTVSNTYTVKVEFVVGKRPEVTVLAPELERREGLLTHVFPHDHLCLSRAAEWNASMSLATTIIPWTSEWLFFYEIWVVTGNWNGGGHEFPAGSAKPARERPLPVAGARTRR
jgi:hypothetical protein